MSRRAPCAMVSPMPTSIPTYVVAVRFADRSSEMRGQIIRKWGAPLLWFRLDVPEKNPAIMRPQGFFWQLAMPSLGQCIAGMLRG